MTFSVVQDQLLFEVIQAQLWLRCCTLVQFQNLLWFIVKHSLSCKSINHRWNWLVIIVASLYGQVLFNPVQQCSGILQDSWKVVSAKVGSHAHSTSTHQKQKPLRRSVGFGLITGPGLHGLSHSLPLSEDGLTGPSPLSWPFEAILVWSAGTE